jgi:MFS family permease
MFSWGLLSGAMAFIGGPISFYVVRVLLGIAEAGFFPGIIFFLTLWFPAAYRARIIGSFIAAVPLSAVIGGPCVWTTAPTGWSSRHERMAVAVHPGSCAGADPIRRGVLLSD